MSSNKKIIVITGPTATGKTSMAVKLANDINGEIISADSRQIYKGMDLGTGKDLFEYSINGNKINYHLIDILNPHEDYSVYNFQKDFFKSYETIKRKKKIPILSGGTGLYIESILLDYDLSDKPPPDPEIRNELSTHDKNGLIKILSSISSKAEMNEMILLTKKQIIRNIEILKTKKTFKGQKFSPQNNNALVICLKMDTDKLRQKIKLRLIDRINNGMINEVQNLLRNGLSIKRLDYFGLEYKHVGEYLKKNITKDQLIDDLSTSIRKFAKRQRTWFRRMEKRGVLIHWIDYNDYKSLKQLVSHNINGL